MQRLFPLESKTYNGSAASLIVPLDQLPVGYRLRGILASLEITATQSAAAAAVTAATLNQIFSYITIGKRFRATGQALNALWWAMNGRDPSLAADIPATNSTAFSRRVNLWCPFADFDAYEPDDTSPNTALFKDEPMQVDLATLTAIAATLTGATTATLKCTAVLEKTQNDVIATPTRVAVATYAGQNIRLDPGSYTHIVAYKEDGSAFTSAEVSAVSMHVDGEPFATRVGIHELAEVFNALKAKGSAVQSLSATAEVAGEALASEPGVGGAAGTGVSVGPFLPIYIPRVGYKLTKALHARRGVTLDFEGTLTSFSILTRRAEPQSAEQVVKAAAKQGIVARAVKPKTSSKADLPDGSYAAALLPKRVG